MSLDRPPEAPAATSATPENETTVASQWRACRCSIRSACATRATKIGSVPNISATVAAVVRRTA